MISEQEFNGQLSNRLPFRTIVRLGSTTDLKDTTTNGGYRIELNTIQGHKQTTNKELMKKIFIENLIPTSRFFICNNNPENIQEYIKEKGYTKVEIKNIKFPLVAKRKYHQKSIGMKLLNTIDEFKEFLLSEETRKNTYHYEQFFNGCREYRIHASPYLKDEILAVRKVRERNKDNSLPWMFNLEQGGFLLEFERPENWEEIIIQVKKAIKSLEMDLGAADVRTSKDGKSFVIIEINSAPGVGDITAIKYAIAIKNILIKKYEDFKSFNRSK